MFNFSILLTCTRAPGASSRESGSGAFRERPVSSWLRPWRLMASARVAWPRGRQEAAVTSRRTPASFDGFDAHKIAYFRAWTPNPVPLADLVAAACARWHVDPLAATLLSPPPRDRDHVHHWSEPCTHAPQSVLIGPVPTCSRSSAVLQNRVQSQYSADGSTVSRSISNSSLPSATRRSKRARLAER